MPDLNSDLTATLRAVAETLSTAQDPWWVIGSSAVALHGGEPGVVADVDVITSRRDLDDLYTRLPLTNTPEEGKAMFTSERFGRWSENPLDVEFMAHLKLRVGKDWQPVEPQSREAIQLDERTLYVPEKSELIAILHRFGREKDLRRAATLT
ncbi:MAG: hypothetical protein AAFW59_04230 [Pseudomonadota bacterium]